MILSNQMQMCAMDQFPEMRLPMEEYTFDAFISYSHRDLSWGTWLQKKIETFRIPKDMRGERPKARGCAYSGIRLTWQGRNCRTL